MNRPDSQVVRAVGGKGDFNYGVTQVLFNGRTPVIHNALGHPNTSAVRSARALSEQHGECRSNLIGRMERIRVKG